MEGFMIRGWALILPECRWLHELQPISDQPVGLGFHTVRGGIDLGGHHFLARFVGVVNVWKDF